MTWLPAGLPAGLPSGVLAGLLAGLLGAAAPVAAAGTGPQGVSYRIEAVLDEDAQVLRGRARLRYTNRSGMSLDSLYFHQHLNAFRPNSAWARREASRGELRFQRLGAAAHAFERLTAASIDGVAVQPHHPYAPDSTVLALPLPAALAPGESVTVELAWVARPATLPRRQGRRGRHWDMAHWYPRIAVHDSGGWRHHPLLPQGEFHGEFASYDVTLEIAHDQVIGATGVPVSGDPGWAGAAAAAFPPAGTGADAYPETGAAEALGLLGATAPAGRRHVRWRAEQVHHFAWSASPAFRYEGGRHGSTLLHVLYQEGDTSWAGGAALRRMRRALDFLEHVFGGYAWPQITNVHRIERGGTEFPMLMMNGSASQGLIVHELAHQYAHGKLANNEWLEAWLDEGMAAFLTHWYWEREGNDTIWLRLTLPLEERERRGATQPVATPAADFVDMATYSAMAYDKAALVLRMLREHVGGPTFLRILRSYYERHRFTHVTGADFERVAAEAAAADLGWFFDQWLRSTARLDYGIADAVTAPHGAGWRTVVEVFRRGEAWMPVTLRVGEEEVILASRDRRQVVEVITAARPRSAGLDPDRVLIDYDRSNDTRPVRTDVPDA
jgi:hypothetical protein